MSIYFNIKKGLSSALPSTKKEGTVYFTTDNGKLYIDTSNSARVAINAVKADQAGTLNSLRPTLSTGNEHNAITIQTMDNGELASLISNSFSAIRAGIDFPWYNTHWRIGNLRGGSTDSGGFGFAYSANGTTWTSCSYIKPDGTYMGTANYANSATTARITSRTFDRDSSNALNLVTIYDTNKTTLRGLIGFHNTGGDGTGSAYIIPYPATVDTWSGTEGLFIGKGILKIDGANVLTSSNYSSYTVTKTGSGASGTWGISITGNAATATAFSSNRTIALTGAVTGSISSNGASGWSIDTAIKNHGISPTNFTSTFRSQTKGDSNSGSYFAVIRNDNTDSWGSMPIYGSGIAFGRYDTHTYLYTAYNDVLAYIGGGSGNNLNWVRRICFTGGEGATGTWGISITGNAATATRASQDGNGATISSTYLKLSGGTMAGHITMNGTNQIKSANTGSSYWKARDLALVRHTTHTASSSYSPIYSMKGLSGDFACGLIHYSSGESKIEWRYTTDATYNAGLNDGSSLLMQLDSYGSLYASKVYGAVWNDYAEFRETTTEIEPGRIVIENGNDTLSLCQERLMATAQVVSDTFGFAIGETDNCKTPLAVSGRVLAYTDMPRETFQAGDTVCSGINGTVSKMTREEIMMYPERIIGVVSAIPEYETWGTGDVKVNGRIWIKLI